MRLIVTLLLLAFTAPAWAEWVKYFENDDAAMYYDSASVKKRGHHRRAWQIVDLKGNGSARALAEYDCKEERWRQLSATGHSGQMASGRILQSHNYPSAQWDYIPPDTPAATMLKLVCTK